jgi:hypothetical protein
MFDTWDGLNDTLKYISATQHGVTSLISFARLHKGPHASTMIHGHVGSSYSGSIAAQHIIIVFMEEETDDEVLLQACLQM